MTRERKVRRYKLDSTKPTDTEKSRIVIIGEVFADLRQAAGLNQVEVGTRVGFSFQLVSRIENGYPSLKYAHIDRMARFYNLTTVALLKLAQAKMDQMREL